MRSHIESHTLSSDEIRVFFTDDKTKIPLRTETENEYSNIATPFIVDCAIVNGQLVIYEWQSPLNSGIGEQSLRKLLGPDLTFFGNGWIVSTVIRGEDQKPKQLREIFFPPMFNADLFSGQFEWEKKQKGHLSILDLDMYSNVLSENASEQIFLSRLHKDKNFLSAIDHLSPASEIFRSKHFQRLFLSHLGLNPPFVFIEKKSHYTEKDIEEIKSNLKLSDTTKSLLKLIMERMEVETNLLA